MDTISRSAALQIAQAKVHELASAAGDDFALQPNHTREIEQGWVFFFNSAEYVRTGNYIHALAGNGPLLVLRNGNVVMLPSAVPWEGVVSEMARPAGGRAA
ncbi:hypothetical protein FHW83_000780 [Duganella sp. SG902]|uniref:YrhB domain-containing protein n=1 Tax=Duganella sp. SG902 TaxID=2587016 RepID=UPI00159EB3B5|nr:YrhB domain-containing protein [Duganella sp. SG902]NVM75000.1 hypothetical protein [Duganella sp. SG902]